MLFNQVAFYITLQNNQDVLDFCKKLLNAPKICYEYELRTKLDEQVKQGLLANLPDEIYNFSCPLISNIFMEIFVGATNRQRNLINPLTQQKGI